MEKRKVLPAKLPKALPFKTYPPGLRGDDNLVLCRMGFRVMLHRLFVVVGCVEVVAMRCVSVVGGLVMGARFMMVSRCAMMFGGGFMMVRCVSMVFCSCVLGFSHNFGIGAVF